MHPRVIAQGRPVVADDAPDGGELNMAPWGLGYLVWGGYVTDVRAFFCPSSGDGNSGTMTSGTANIKSPYMGGRPFFRLKHYQRMGFGRKGLFFGDSEWLSRSYYSAASGYELTYVGNSSIHGRGALCDYVYRGVPVRGYYGHYGYEYSANPKRTWGDSPDPAERDAGFEFKHYIPVAYTRPVHNAVAGCAQFKTAKQLSNRALVADTYCKNAKVYDPPAAGEGLTGHREGNHVLYGDYSTRWLGDPQQRIIWWNQTNTSYGDRDSNQIGFWMSTLCMYNYTTPSFGTNRGRGGLDPTSATYRERSWYAVWHQFDTAADIDVSQ